jgi:cytochrome c553
MGVACTIIYKYLPAPIDLALTSRASLSKSIVIIFIPTPESGCGVYSMKIILSIIGLGTALAAGHALAQATAADRIPDTMEARVQACKEIARAGARRPAHRHAGIPGKKIPACVTWHGAELGGRGPGIPGLLGLRADYVSAQLGAWRFGVRTALAPDCMQVIASSLSEPEVAALSAYLASLPVTAARPLRNPA